MLIGVITGAYSSIFVATPLLVVLKERESRFKQHRARLEARPGERRLRPVPGPAAGDDDAAAESAAVGAAAAARTTARSAQGSPRPGSKSRRKPPAKRKRR
jgi:preprotein translocase subunit SecF